MPNRMPAAQSAELRFAVRIMNQPGSPIPYTARARWWRSHRRPRCARNRRSPGSLEYARRPDAVTPSSPGPMPQPPFGPMRQNRARSVEDEERRRPQRASPAPARSSSVSSRMVVKSTSKAIGRRETAADRAMSETACWVSRRIVENRYCQRGQRHEHAHRPARRVHDRPRLEERAQVEGHRSPRARARCSLLAFEELPVLVCCAYEVAQSPPPIRSWHRLRCGGAGMGKPDLASVIPAGPACLDGERLDIAPEPRVLSPAAMADAGAGGGVAGASGRSDPAARAEPLVLRESVSARASAHCVILAIGGVMPRAIRSEGHVVIDHWPCWRAAVTAGHLGERSRRTGSGQIGIPDSWARSAHLRDSSVRASQRSRVRLVRGRTPRAGKAVREVSVLATRGRVEVKASPLSMGNRQRHTHHRAVAGGEHRIADGHRPPCRSGRPRGTRPPPGWRRRRVRLPPRPPAGVTRACSLEGVGLGQQPLSDGFRIHGDTHSRRSPRRGACPLPGSVGRTRAVAHRDPGGRATPQRRPVLCVGVAGFGGSESAEVVIGWPASA